jgi:PAS domain S-box-containing protein
LFVSVASAEFLMMLMPLAAAAAILLGRQQQRLATLEREGAQLRRAVLDLEALVERAPLGLGVLDRDLRYVRLNQLLADINGLAIEEHIGKTLHDVVPDIAQTAEARLRTVMRTRTASVGLVFKGVTGAQPAVLRTWRESLYPLQGHDGEVLGVTVAVEDITEQQRLMEALRDSQLREQRRARELESLMHAAPAALLVAGDRACYHVRGNAAAERLLRLRPGENPSLSGPATHAYTVYDGVRPLPVEQLPLQRAAAHGEEIWEQPLTVRFADGGQVHVAVNAVPLRDERGEVVGAVAAFTDTGASLARQA